PRVTAYHIGMPRCAAPQNWSSKGRDGSNSVIRRCWLNLRFARKRTRLADFMSPPPSELHPACERYDQVSAGGNVFAVSVALVPGRSGTASGRDPRAHSPSRTEGATTLPSGSDRGATPALRRDGRARRA